MPALQGEMKGMNLTLLDSARGVSRGSNPRTWSEGFPEELVWASQTLGCMPELSLKWPLVFALLSAAAVALPKAPPAMYPPDGVILLQRKPEVTLRCELPKGEIFAELWSEGKKALETTLREGTWSVTVDPGKSYSWIMHTPAGASTQGSFSLANDFSFNIDGRSGAPGPAWEQGRPGTDGGQVEAELRRDSAGMHLRIHTQGQDLHYLFAESELRFKISARGGNGGRGADGQSFQGYEYALGRDGGEAGWGGNLKITTYDAPWRDYLEVDLSPGQPGAGGIGGEYYSGKDKCKAPNGQPGKAGQVGRVDTRLGP
jgi:hypothetical protein